MRAFVVRERRTPVGFTMLAAPAARTPSRSTSSTSRRTRADAGLGGRLVEAALAAGGRDVAWVVADDEGKARALYERLGFDTVWRAHTSVRGSPRSVRPPAKSVAARW